MSDDDNILPFPRRASPPPLVSFHRTELGLILSVYGRFVAAGEWRDYAIDSGADAAFFSIHRSTRERPVYIVEKRPRNAHKQGQYAVMGVGGQVLKRGRDLRMVLRIFDRKLLRLADPAE